MHVTVSAEVARLVKQDGRVAKAVFRRNGKHISKSRGRRQQIDINRTLAYALAAKVGADWASARDKVSKEIIQLVRGVLSEFKECVSNAATLLSEALDYPISLTTCLLMLSHASVMQCAEFHQVGGLPLESHSPDPINCKSLRGPFQTELRLQSSNLVTYVLVILQ